LKFEQVMSHVNSIRSHGLYHRQFQSSLPESDVYWDGPVATSRGGAVTFLSSEARNRNARHDEKGKVVAELGDEKCLWDLALLCDSSCHLNDLNMKPEHQQKLISVCGCESS